ncbi:MAG TPA: hypothetical protein VHS99_07105 [Chloroflexota bacterium]|nr:hypothetical protein [Chloroflexota bacterium]
MAEYRGVTSTGQQPESGGLSLRLTRAEVAVLAQLLGGANLHHLLWLSRPGGAETEAGLNLEGEFPPQALEAARATLQERRLLATAGRGLLQIDYGALALVGTCAAPHLSLRYSALIGEAVPRERTFHHLAEMVVEHLVEAGGEHRFTAFTSPLELYTHVASLIHLASQPRPAGQEFGLTLRLEREAWVAAVNDGALGVRHVLREARVEPISARSLARAMANPRALTQFLAFQHHPEEHAPVSLGNLTLLEGPAGFWAFVQDDPDSDDLDVRPLAAHDVDAMLAVAVGLMGWAGPAAAAHPPPSGSRRGLDPGRGPAGWHGGQASPR